MKLNRYKVTIKKEFYIFSSDEEDCIECVENNPKLLHIRTQNISIKLCPLESEIIDEKAI